MQRADDNEESLKKRLRAYHEETTPVARYYEKQGIHSVINADQPAPVVWKNILDAFACSGHVPRVGAIGVAKGKAAA